MAFVTNDLGVAGYSHGWTLWHYKSSDGLSEIGGSGYFNLAADMVARGDEIHVNARDGIAIYAVTHADIGLTKLTLMMRTPEEVG